MAKNVWNTRQSKKSVRINAKIMLGKTKVQIIPLDSDEGEKYICKLENCPDNIAAGEWKVSMSEDGEKVYSISPIEGMFNLEFSGFFKKEEDKIPTPQHAHYEGKDPDGSAYSSDYDYFTLIFDITGAPSGDEAAVGMTVGKRLRYYFFDDGGVVGFDKPKSKYCSELKDWLADMGVFDGGTLSFSENILPALEKRIIKANKKLIGTIKDGYLINVVESKLAKAKKAEPVEVEEEINEETEPETKPMVDDDFGASFDDEEEDWEE